MSDYNSSLPIRTENAGDVAVKVVDSLGVNQLKVESDGSINTNTTISATNLDIRDLVFATDKVDVTGSTVALDSTTLAALENITVSATDLDIRNLVFATDKVDASGSVVALDSTTLAALENITVSATNLDIRDLAFATDKVDASGSSVSISGTPTVDISASSLAALESVTVQNAGGASAVNIQDGGNSITVDASNLDIRDLTHVSDSVKIGDGTDFLAINADGSINTVEAAVAGIADYNTAAAVAGGGSSTHTYTSTGNFYLTGVESSGSGKAKIVLSVNGVTKLTQFNSTSTPNMSAEFKKPLLVTVGQTVTVVRTNRDNQAQDLYSTVMGFLG